MTTTEQIEQRPAKKDQASLVARLLLFIRQVISELKKVVWPTRRELRNYTVVVIVFVVTMGALVAVADYVLTRGVLWLFG